MIFSTSFRYNPITADRLSEGRFPTVCDTYGTANRLLLDMTTKVDGWQVYSVRLHLDTSVRWTMVANFLSRQNRKMTYLDLWKIRRQNQNRKWHLYWIQTRYPSGTRKRKASYYYRYRTAPIVNLSVPRVSRQTRSCRKLCLFVCSYAPVLDYGSTNGLYVDRVWATVTTCMNLGHINNFVKQYVR